MKFSACMMVSRRGPLLERAVESVIRQRPDEFRAYLDSHILGDETEEVKKYLESRGAKVFLQRYDPERVLHHLDVSREPCRIISEADYEWVAWIDDDDEMLSDRRAILKEYAADDVGVIYGDVVAVVGGKIFLRRTRQITRPEDAYLCIGSGVIYNRDAVREITPLAERGKFWDRATYWDYRIVYWLLKKGWKAVYVPKIMSLQNINLQVPDWRLELRGYWREIVERYKRWELLQR